MLPCFQNCGFKARIARTNYVDKDPLCIDCRQNENMLQPKEFKMSAWGYEVAAGDTTWFLWWKAASLRAVQFWAPSLAVMMVLLVVWTLLTSLSQFWESDDD
jgi:hypothetical protein